MRFSTLDADVSAVHAFFERGGTFRQEEAPALADALENVAEVCAALAERITTKLAELKEA